MAQTFWAIGAALLSVASAQGTVNIDLTQSQPLSQVVDPSFAGFGIEPSNLFSFTGYSTPNELSFNLIDNLVSYTGAPPHIRLGGNTQDYMVFDQSQEQWTWINNPDPSGAGAFAPNHMLIGPKFFEAANRFPTGTPITWGLNLAYQESDWRDQITTMAKQVVENIPNLKLVSFEIGNEPDLYLQNGFRNGSWGGSVYIEQWLERAQVLYDEVLAPNNLPSNFFEAATTASTIGTSFQVHDLMTLGINVQANNSQETFMKSWNQHDYYYYTGVSSYDLTLERFLTLQTTNDQFAAWEEQIEQAAQTPYPYALREMCSAGPIGLAGITDTFGGALWTLNFFLYGATLNITSVEMHMTDNSNASAWQPIAMYGIEPYVRPNYYGYAAFDQTIGKSCEAQVAEVTPAQTPAGYDGMLKIYSVYQAGNLASVVMINGQMANVSQSNKESLEFVLSFPSSMSGQTLHLATLTNDGADALHGTTWNGISYEQSGNGTPTTVDDSDQTATISSNGQATVTVRDSQAVVAQLGSKVGSGTTPNSTACAAIASRSPGLGSSSRTGSPSSASSSSAASGLRQGGASRTGSSSATATNGVKRLSAIIFSTMGIAAMTGAALILA